MNKNLIQSLILFKKSFYSLVNEQCQKLNLTSAELFLLGILFKEGDLHQIEIAKNLDCDKAHIHRLTAKLIEKGYVSLVDCHHGKNQKLHLSELGEEKAKLFDQIISSVKAIIFRGVSEEEITVTQKTIEKFAKNVSQIKEEKKDV